MSDEFVVTRVKLLSDVHREVKAAAAYADMHMDEAIGALVAFCVGLGEARNVLSECRRGADDDVQGRISSE